MTILKPLLKKHILFTELSNVSLVGMDWQGKIIRQMFGYQGLKTIKC